MRKRRYLVAVLLFLVARLSSPAQAIEVQPNADQIAAALERGQTAATAHTPPDRLYTWFGPDREQAQPHGFLMTKLDGLAVMSAHFGLRGARPSELERDQILADPHLLVTVILFGERPDFAVNSYVLLLQGERKIPPVKVRFDGKADRTRLWPASPPYRAKVVAFFAYADLDPHAKARLSVFPKRGGEESFELDFGVIP
jgi:hypothetical protein